MVSPICKMCWVGEEAEVNARLIAAAPLMLEELQNVLWNFEGKSNLTPVQKKCIEYCKEAIQKAING